MYTQENPMPFDEGYEIYDRQVASLQAFIQGYKGQWDLWILEFGMSNVLISSQLDPLPQFFVITGWTAEQAQQMIRWRNEKLRAESIGEYFDLPKPDFTPPKPEPEPEHQVAATTESFMGRGKKPKTLSDLPLPEAELLVKQWLRDVITECDA